eukprot:TRINITY_DN14545_c0_g6_i1.p1 TRINITY_DN14545_c0_g6~~TRINITY_DN14545_c0_g6_i1.p1  ORF type:complete len:255 (-),score=66.82 TRINITY_DN14545_c0_g6_i1:129-893(-)
MGCQDDTIIEGLLTDLSQSPTPRWCVLTPGLLAVYSDESCEAFMDGLEVSSKLCVLTIPQALKLNRAPPGAAAARHGFILIPQSPLSPVAPFGAEDAEEEAEWIRALREAGADCSAVVPAEVDEAEAAEEYEAAGDGEEEEEEEEVESPLPPGVMGAYIDDFSDYEDDGTCLKRSPSFERLHGKHVDWCTAGYQPPRAVEIDDFSDYEDDAMVKESSITSVFSEANDWTAAKLSPRSRLMSSGISGDTETTAEM